MPHWINIVTMVVFVSSVLHSVLPPWDADAFRPFPSFVKYYKLLIYVVGYVAINARSTIYKSISIENPNGVNRTPAIPENPRDNLTGPPEKP